MRRRPLLTALVVLTAGLTAASALRRRRVSASPVEAPVAAPVEPVVGYDAVVLSFSSKAAAAPVTAQPATPARCGDTGGTTKAGAPCGARATTGGRCHHHRIAA